jgi:hypothetical protein
MDNFTFTFILLYINVIPVENSTEILLIRYASCVNVITESVKCNYNVKL